MNLRVVGIVSTKEGLKLGACGGSREKPVRQPLADTLKYPSETETGAMLWRLQQLLETLLMDVSGVVMIKAVGSQHSHPLEVRVKAEAVLELTCAEQGIRMQLLTPQALRNEEKRFDLYAGGSAEAVLSEGKKFKSVDLKDAVLAAWIGLPA